SIIKSALLFSHNMAAMYFNNQHIQLEDGEAAALAEGAKNVARHYEIVQRFSPQAQDWCNLFIIASSIYSAKYMMARQPLHQPVTEPQMVVPDAQRPHATPGDAPIILPEVVAVKQPPSGDVTNLAQQNTGNATFHPNPVTPEDAYIQ